MNKGVSGNTSDWGPVPGTASVTATNIAIIKTGVTNEITSWSIRKARISRKNFRQFWVWRGVKQ